MSLPAKQPIVARPLCAGASMRAAARADYADTYSLYTVTRALAGGLPHHMLKSRQPSLFIAS
jgi:hypothetical protein